MIRRFFSDERGNYALLTVVAIVPIMGALALGVDYAEMSKQRQETLNALDAAGIATARVIVEGASDDAAKAYAKTFFETNLGSVQPVNTSLTVTLPQNTGGGTLKLTAGLKYKPHFFGAFAKLIGKTSTDVDFSASSEIKLKNTLEVALVLDNSASMLETGGGSTKVRFTLLKEAATEFVNLVAGQAAVMKQVSKPVQFSLVPFAASVNVGTNNAGASWMDTQGISPVHHENFPWPLNLGANKDINCVANVCKKIGVGWPTTEQNQIVTRFTMFNEIKYYTNSQKTQTAAAASWGGCVESRPYPNNINDAKPFATSDGISNITGDPASLFVPMFAPDEAGDAWTATGITSLNSFKAPNSWWNDATTSSTATTRQNNLKKYFAIRPYGKTMPTDKGPNYSCTTKPIKELTDVSTTEGKDAIDLAITNMVAVGATNVPEGMAWGWRTLSSGAPFTTGRPETERGNTKVVIVLTDGANTYYTPGSLGLTDSAGNKSIYSNLGYAAKTTPGYSKTRIFQGTTVSTTDYSNTNYTKAMNEPFNTLCNNVKTAGITVITIALDLDDTKPAEKTQIEALKACASESNYTKDADGNLIKLFYNATGDSLLADFKKIADELSNLRIVG